VRRCTGGIYVIPSGARRFLIAKDGLYRDPRFSPDGRVVAHVLAGRSAMASPFTMAGTVHLVSSAGGVTDPAWLQFNRYRYPEL